MLQVSINTKYVNNWPLWWVC